MFCIKLVRKKNNYDLQIVDCPASRFTISVAFRFSSAMRLGQLAKRDERKTQRKIDEKALVSSGHHSNQQDHCFQCLLSVTRFELVNPHSYSLDLTIICSPTCNITCLGKSIALTTSYILINTNVSMVASGIIC